MESTEIINLWKSYDKKLNETILLNRKNAEDIMKIKIKSSLTSMKPVKLFALLVGIAWVSFGAVILGNLFIYANDKVSPFFLFSAGFQVLLTAAAIFIYLYQLILINQVDISEPILATQEKLATLKSSILLVARILFLQLPLWTTFYWTENMFTSGNKLYIIVNGTITLLFACMAAWLFLNINYENKDQKWFKIIFSGKEWEPVLKSLELYNDIKRENEKIDFS